MSNERHVEQQLDSMRWVRETLFCKIWKMTQRLKHEVSYLDAMTNAIRRREKPRKVLFSTDRLVHTPWSRCLFSARSIKYPFFRLDKEWIDTVPSKLVAQRHLPEAWPWPRDNESVACRLTSFWRGWSQRLRFFAVFSHAWHLPLIEQIEHIASVNALESGRQNQRHERIFHSYSSWRLHSRLL